jgi:hypothetical protein
MSRSSGPKGAVRPGSRRQHGRRGGFRGQVEPLATLGAVVVVATALTVYAGVLTGVLPEKRARPPVEPTADSVERVLSAGGVVHPERKSRVSTVVPEGYRLNATIQTANRTWKVGPDAPASAASATRQVSVRLTAKRLTPGRLEVRLWT